MSEITSLRKRRADAIMELESRLQQKKYFEAQINTAIAEIKQFNRIIIECNEKENAELKKMEEGGK